MDKIFHNSKYKPCKSRAFPPQPTSVLRQHWGTFEEPQGSREHKNPSDPRLSVVAEGIQGQAKQQRLRNKKISGKIYIEESPARCWVLDLVTPDF